MIYNGLLFDLEDACTHGDNHRIAPVCVGRSLVVPLGSRPRGEISRD